MLYNNQEYYYPGMPQPAMPNMALNRKCYFLTNFCQPKTDNLKTFVFIARSVMFEY